MYVSGANMLIHSGLSSILQNRDCNIRVPPSGHGTLSLLGVSISDALVQSMQRLATGKGPHITTELGLRIL